MIALAVLSHPNPTPFYTTDAMAFVLVVGCCTLILWIALWKRLMLNLLIVSSPIILFLAFRFFFYRVLNSFNGMH